MRLDLSDGGYLPLRCDWQKAGNVSRHRTNRHDAASYDVSVKVGDTLERDASRPAVLPRSPPVLCASGEHNHTPQNPPNASDWSTRSVAAPMEISDASVRRIWRSHGLKPHRVASFKISNDPEFAENMEDIVCLYLNPPEHPLVLCVDEKSQIQALDRTQPGLPLKRGRSQTMTHYYKLNGATLFAALNATNGEVYGFCRERHRHRTLDRRSAHAGEYATRW